MLGGLTATQILEWQVYDELDPFGEERADYRSAQIVQALWNIARDATKHPNGWSIEEFVLAFGDTPRLAKVPQSLETMELLIDSWIAGSNAVFANKGN